jgi:hypothetical protein
VNSSATNTVKVPKYLSYLQYVPSLIGKGFAVELDASGSGFTVEPKNRISDSLRDQIKSVRDRILIDLYVCKADPAERLGMLLDARGWALLRSAVLGGAVVLILKSEDALANVPEAIAKRFISYTLEECILIGAPCDAEALKSIHELKVTGLGRRVIPEDSQWIVT